ncbi:MULTISPECIES: hypothetical protein [Amycolatopsis]|uniref:Uncharacterized protein n=1 Tax=Amycolatopsis albidoflavus TaxID=102226 RepID=A0ABW5HR74_9PSEU
MQGLFEVGPLIEAEAMRRHVAGQIPGQVDIWEACAEAQPAPFAWPEPVGALYARDDVTGVAVLA